MSYKDMPRIHRKNLIALAAAAMLMPCGAWALDLAQSPPGSSEPYVRPNVIISIDDSGSMGFRLDKGNTNNATNNTTPNADGTWPTSSRRMNVLKYSLNQVFNDSSLLPDGKIRLAWQAMWNNSNTVSKYNDLSYWYGGSTSNPGKGKTPGADNVNSNESSRKNKMRILDSTQRANFLEFVNYLLPNNGTPSHQMLSRADAYMRKAVSQDGPWASTPGKQGAPYLGCRRNYHIFMTDGRWNGTVSGGSQDDNTTNITLPDGEVYGSTSAGSRPYNQLYSDNYNNTLADWAFYSWSKPLLTSGLTGTMKTTSDYNKSPTQENFGKDSDGKDAVLSRYWNPRYNPATWPHMVTYTIGFSDEAYTWPGASNITAPTEKVPFGYDGSFPDLVTGKKTWPQMDAENKRALDLWHSALNGRGRFYAVQKGEDLEKAFRDIFSQINANTDPNLSSSATSGSNITRLGVERFISGYDPQSNWKGYVQAETIKTDGSIISANGWGGKNTAEKIDVMNIGNRVVISWSDKTVSNNEKGGVPFRWASGDTNLSTSQKTALQTGIDGTDGGSSKGEQRLNYIRGERSLEGSESTGYTTSKPYRERSSRQGDIINSNIWFTGVPSSGYSLKGYAAFTLANVDRPKMIYVGGNDGMLHGFAAADGAEKIAYVPKGVIPTLNRLTDPSFNTNHRFFVDGTPMTGDVDVREKNKKDEIDNSYTPDWRTMLVGTLGNGGKGFFVLDVTKPENFAEGNANSLAVIDRTQSAAIAPADCTLLTDTAQTVCQEAADIGHIVAAPVLDPVNPMRTTQIVRMNNNRWAVVLGNGYNSASQRPVLLVQYLDGDHALIRLPATTDAAGTGKANDNGLAAPRLIDLNGDGRMDIAYAGDNLGNLWKFDLTSADVSDWKVAFDGAPLFTARGPASLGSASRPKIQPITAPPTVRANDRYSCDLEYVGGKESCKKGTTKAVGGVMVAFGTGRNITQNDPASNDVQTLYSVLDNTRYVFDKETNRLAIRTSDPAPQTLGEGVTAAKLAQQKFVELDDGSSGRIEHVDELNKFSWQNKNGWYLDLPAVGERLLKPMELYQNSNLLVVYSQVPAKGKDVDPDIESCETAAADEERQWRTFVNIMDGKRPSVQLVDANGDGLFFTGSDGSGDGNISRVQVAKGAHNIIGSRGTTPPPDGSGGPGGCLNFDIDIKGNKEILACMPEVSMRPSWRQYQ